MSDDTLTALSQRPAAFWIALALLLGGSLVPDTVTLSGQSLGGLMVGLAALILVTRVVVALARVFRNAASAARVGYESGQVED
ncbi:MULTISPECIES: hypothetical protein [Salinibaculum]|uniref:hypothetical protein n=1 Tax=Salinibaculum TaxID=2732368 RepID=UPI0030CE77B2